uniref:Tuftelin 1 n=1 Tax=Sphenodon punctatus TaxID=8508 RepID=A0A8D0GA67_SPHPU
MTLQNLPGERRDPVKHKPIGKAFAMVAGQTPNGHSLSSERIQSSDGDEEIIKVSVLNVPRKESSDHGSVPSPCFRPLLSLGLRPETQRLLCLQEEECAGDDAEKMRETAKRLYTKLQEAEKRHRSDKAAYETTISHYQKEAEQAGAALRVAEEDVAAKDMKLEELQRLLSGMEKEHQTLLRKMKEGEGELEKLRSLESEKLAEQERSAKLEKEVASLREKIHHLDDMLKSQQRKVRQMIEQLQNSKTVIQSKDAIIQELKERVAYLEAENLEMHDRMEHLIEKQVCPSTRLRSKSDSVNRWAKNEA